MCFTHTSFTAPRYHHQWRSLLLQPANILIVISGPACPCRFATPAGSHQVQVPLEDILQLASCLMSHLLQHPPVADPRSPPRKQRNRRRTVGGRDAAAAGTEEAADGVPAAAAGEFARRRSMYRSMLSVGPLPLACTCRQLVLLFCKMTDNCSMH
jgi:hypothetical protein